MSYTSVCSLPGPVKQSTWSLLFFFELKKCPRSLVGEHTMLFEAPMGHGWIVRYRVTVTPCVWCGTADGRPPQRQRESEAYHSTRRVSDAAPPVRPRLHRPPHHHLARPCHPVASRKQQGKWTDRAGYTNTMGDTILYSPQLPTPELNFLLVATSSTYRKKRRKAIVATRALAPAPAPSGDTRKP